MTFVPGHELSALLYREIAPTLAAEFPGLRFAAGLIGAGSDVLGYDTARSMDHDWGPRLTLVLTEADHPRCADRLYDVIEAALPDEVAGVPVDQRPAHDRPEDQLQHHNTAGRPRPHGITVHTLPSLMSDILGIDDLAELDAATWLSIPAQRLLEFTAGPIHRDDDGAVTAARQALAFYPDDVWLAAMAGWWQRAAQLEAFAGRTQELGDEIGAHVIAASLVRIAMNLALLQQRQYPPYAKWLGTAVRRTSSDALTALMHDAVTARGADQQHGLATLLAELGRAHNALGLTEPVNTAVTDFFERPYPVIWAGRFAEALNAAITDPAVAALPRDIGGIDAITDSITATNLHGFRRSLREWWRQPRQE